MVIALNIKPDTGLCNNLVPRQFLACDPMISTADLVKVEIMSRFLLRTDANGHRWEIRRRPNGTFEHRREGRVHWVEGWPSLPPLKNDDDTFAKGS